MSQPAEILALSDELRTFTARAWQQLQDAQNAILDTWPAASRDARRKRLADLQHAVTTLTAQVDELALALATTGIHSAYTTGAATVGGQFTSIDVDALGVLAQDTYDYLLSATKAVSSSTKILIRTLARQHVGDRLTAGQTAEQAGRELRKDLESKGIHSVTYKDGSRQGLAGYSEMIGRTQTALAFNQGALNAATREGIKYMEVFDGVCGWTYHDDPDAANGTVRTVDECNAYPLSHPRCVRGFGARPDVTSRREAGDAVPSQTAAQVADQVQVQADRTARLQARRARLNRRAAKVGVRS